MRRASGPFSEFADAGTIRRGFAAARVLLEAEDLVRASARLRRLGFLHDRIGALEALRLPTVAPGIYDVAASREKKD